MVSVGTRVWGDSAVEPVRVIPIEAQMQPLFCVN